ncbi:MAG: 2-amino-4-hydroxy-6-hydroxymethyldihydropteridine diphosphokinase [Bacteroidetes bacterium]|nr:2-amino-4-hydroxy-6-hydroxymethyldihydropteridine diphosphokinase [Bacteroidota bacterium]
MNTAYLCLGGNMGNREQYLSEAIACISVEAGTIKNCSPCYETPAWGVDNQAHYLNCCVELTTDLSPLALMQKLLGIEQKLGRIRESMQYAPRTIDIDILFYNQEVIHTDTLIIPHPRLHLRRFVLTPLHAMAPAFVHPLLKQSIAELLQACNDNSSITLYPKTLCTSV